MTPTSWRSDHRPWEVPDSPWVLFMRWKDLSFLHWPVAPELVAPHLPAGLSLDTFEGRAWIGITPFEMRNVRARAMPAVPGISSFPELNVRTYVLAGGKPGVWFMSLDAGSALAVRAARWSYGLPYFRARMAVGREGDRLFYRSERLDTNEDARLQAVCAPTGPVHHAEPGTLEHWLTERYCLYVLRGGRLFRGDIHHEPWPLQQAEAEVALNTMTEPFGIGLGPEPPLVHFSSGLDVIAWMLRPV